MPLKISVISILYKWLIRNKVMAVIFFPASIFCKWRQEGYPCSSASSSVQPLLFLISRSLSPRRLRNLISDDVMLIPIKSILIHPISSTSDSMYLFSDLITKE